MKVKSIYKNNKIYVAGKNPNNKRLVHIYEVDDKVYEDEIVENYSYCIRTIRELNEEEVKSLENLPPDSTEYVGNYKIVKQNGNKEEEEVSLTYYHVDNCDSKEIQSKINDEEFEVALDRVIKHLENNPQFNFESKMYTKEQVEFIDLIIIQIARDISNYDAHVAPKHYDEIFKNMENIVKGISMITARYEPKNGEPEEIMVTPEVIKDGKIDCLKENEYYTHSFEVEDLLKRFKLSIISENCYPVSSIANSVNCTDKELNDVYSFCVQTISFKDFNDEVEK